MTGGLLWITAGMALLCWSGVSGGPFVPTKYDVRLTLDLDSGSTFQGEAVIDLRTTDEVGRDRTDFELSASGLKVSYVQISYPNYRVATILPKNIKVNNQSISIPGPEFIRNNSDYSIALIYEGNHSLDGIYRATYENRSFIGSNFYPTGPLKAFPCINRPDAVVNTSLTIDINYQKLAKIEPTLLIGDKSFVGKDGKIKGTHTGQVVGQSLFFTAGYYKALASLKVWFPTETNVLPNTAVSVNTPDMDTLLKSVGLSKRMVIVPGLPETSAGGSGLIAVSVSQGIETATTSEATQKLNAVTILQAIARSVFTSFPISSWNDVWIPEVISKYLASHAVQQVPKWSSWDAAAELVERALETSWSEGSLPIMPRLNNSSQVVEYIKSPAVGKGAALWNMMETTLVLNKAERAGAFIDYVKNLNGSAMETRDFLMRYSDYHGLNSSARFPSGVALQDLLSPWLNQTGFPAIRLTRRNSDVFASQSRYGDNKISNLWVVPLNYKLLSNQSDSEESLIWFVPQQNAELKLVTVDKSTPVTLNPQGTGLYRTLYDQSNMELIMEALNSSVDALSESARKTILSDSIAFAKSGDLSYAVLLQYMNYLEKERALGPWQAATRGLRDLWIMLFFSDMKTQFQNQAMDWLRYTYVAKGRMDTSSTKDGSLRAIVAKYLCDFGDEGCRTDAKAVPGDVSKITASDLIPTIYCNKLRDANISTIMENLKVNYAVGNSEDSKKAVFSYIFCSSQNITRVNLLENILVNNVLAMPADDILMAFDEATTRPENLDLYFQYVTLNYGKLSKTLTSQHKAKMISILGQKGSTTTHWSSLSNFNGGNDTLVINAAKTALASIQSRKDFLKNHYEDIYVGLYSHGSDNPTPTPTTGPGPEPTPPGPTPPTPPGPTTTDKPGGAAAVSSAIALLAAALLAVLKAQ